MAVWRSSEQWQPRQFGWLMPAELPPFVAWLLPGIFGGLALLASRNADGSLGTAPESLSQLGLLNAYWTWTLLYTPLWGFPAVIAALPLRGILLAQGWFGWASALLSGALAGVAVPLMLGDNFWIAGPLYGAAFLWVQHVIYRFSQGPRS